MADCKEERYALLDAFRGLSILWIVCFHMLPYVNIQYNPLVNSILMLGHPGLSVFFVISGYGIAASTRSSTMDFVPAQTFSWLWLRMKRIFPTYWWHILFAALVIPLAASPFAMLKLNPVSNTFCYYSMWEWIQFVTLTKVFSSSSWTLAESFEPLNRAVWYLAIIVQIYIIVALCMLFTRKRWRLSLVLFIIFLASLLTFIPSIKVLLPFGLFLPYFGEVYVGIIVYYMLSKGLTPKSKIVTLTISVFLLCILYYCAIMANHFVSLFFASTMGYIFLLLHKHDHRLSNLAVVRPFCAIGIFSYSLYLLHIPLYPSIRMFVRNLIPLSPALTYPLVLVPCIILASFMWYLFFEKPSTQRDVIRVLKSPLKTISSGRDFIQSFIHPNSRSKKPSQ